MFERIAGFVRTASRSDFVGKVGETAVYRALLLILGVANSIVVARFLGPSGRGLLAVATTFQGIGAQLSNLGLQTSNTYLLAKDRSGLPALTANSLAVSLALGGGGALAALAYLSSRHQLAELPVPLLSLALLSVPVFLAFMFLLNLLLGLQEVRWFNRVEAGVRAVALGFIAFAAVIGWRSPTLFFVCSLAATALGVVVCLKVLAGRMAGPMRFSLPLLQRGCRYGVKSYLASLFVFLLLKVDILLLNKWRSAVETGLYSVAAALADLLLMFPMVVSMLLFPKLAAEPDMATRWRNTRRVLIVLTGVLFGVVALSALLAKPAISVMYGPQFVGSAEAFYWLLPGVLFLGLSNALNSFVAAHDIPVALVPYTAGLVLLNYWLNTQLIPGRGIVGAAMASSICYALLLPFNVYQARRLLKGAR